MILIGQYDSSFTRRVGIALTLYGLAFEHRPWSIFGDADKLRAVNPLLRVPTLVLDDSTVLIETGAILDHLDRLMPEAERLYPAAGMARSAAIRVAALASGIADLMVSLFYERAFHPTPSDVLVARRAGQIRDTLALLERECAARGTPFWFGDRFGHADIAIGATLTHLAGALPDLWEPEHHPALAALHARMEALPVFKAVFQRFIPPGG